MKKIKSTNKILLIAVCIISISACKKKENSQQNSSANSPTSAQMIADFCTHVGLADYTDLYNNAISFQTAENSFNTNANDVDLATMRTAWKGMRAAYEAGEAFLIGPIATLNLDPNIDTWPVEQNTLDSLLNSTAAFTPSFMNSLSQSLTGFHPIEYLIYGTSGNIMAASFTQRQKDYLSALTTHLMSNITLIRDSYVVNSSDDYATVMNTAGPSNSTYTTRKAVLLNLVDAMSGICDEVGGHASDGKIWSVYSTQDITLQESFFSNNSWTDFKNNISGIKNVYMCSYANGTPGNNFNDFVASRNLSLNNIITQSINTAINSFNTVHLPFGQSVQTVGGERTQVLNIMNAIDSLKSTLDNRLRPFINQYVND